MDRGDTTQGLGNPGENADSYFHPLLGSLFPVQTGQAIEIEEKSPQVPGNSKATWRIRVEVNIGVLAGNWQIKEVTWATAYGAVRTLVTLKRQGASAGMSA